MIVLALMARSVGAGLLLAALGLMATRALGARQASSGSLLFNMARSLGGSVGAALCAAFLAIRQAHHTDATRTAAEARMPALHDVLGVAFVILLLLALTLLAGHLLRRPGARGRSERQMGDSTVFGDLDRAFVVDQAPPRPATAHARGPCRRRGPGRPGHEAPRAAPPRPHRRSAPRRTGVGHPCRPTPTQLRDILTRDAATWIARRRIPAPPVDLPPTDGSTAPFHLVLGRYLHGDETAGLLVRGTTGSAVGSLSRGGAMSWAFGDQG